MSTEDLRKLHDKKADLERKISDLEKGQSAVSTDALRPALTAVVHQIERLARQPQQ